MNHDAILIQLKQLAERQCKRELLELTESTRFANLPGWNSLQHVMFIDAVEKHFSHEFDLMTVMQLETFEDMVHQLLSAR